jgi:RNase adapter protein RapZ
MDPNPVNLLRVVMVTGPSGAGRTTAIRAFEDMGFEAIDNLPLRLVAPLIDASPPGRPIALGLDVRNRDFAATALIELIDSLTRDPRVALEVLYLDCAPDVLIRRYSETRRRHPLAPRETPAEGIAREIDLLAPIRVRADQLIDTTDLSVHDTKAEIGRWFSRDTAEPMAVSLQSFSYKRGIPRGVDMVFDCRFLANPHWQAALKARTGQDPAVRAYIAGDARFQPFFDKVCDLVTLLLPANLDEGKAHLSIAFGCTGGQHRSVALVEMMGDALAQTGWAVSKRHLELERRGPAAAAPDAPKVRTA